YTQLIAAEPDIHWFEDDVSRSHDVAKMESLLQEKDLRIADYIITGDQRYVEEYEELLDEYSALIDKLESRMETNEQQESFDLILQNDTDINKQFDEIIEADDLDSVMITTRRIRANELRGTTIHLIDQLIDDISRSINSSITVLSSINIIASVSGVAIMLFISFLIRRNLNKVINMTTEVADGNLTVASIDYQGEDEIGQLAKAVNQMKENIY